MSRIMSKGNEIPMANRPQTYANFIWEKRWNNIRRHTPVAALDQDGDRFMVVNCMGVIYCDKEDLEHIRRQLQASIDMLENAADR